MFKLTPTNKQIKIETVMQYRYHLAGLTYMGSRALTGKKLTGGTFNLAVFKPINSLLSRL